MTDERAKDDEAQQNSPEQEPAAERQPAAAPGANEGQPAAEQPAAPPADAHVQTPERPAEAFKRGLGLLWRAARGAAQDLREEAKRADVSRTLQDAGEKIEHAADTFVRGLERMVEKVQPPSQRAAQPPGAEQAPDDAAGQAPDRGTDQGQTAPQSAAAEAASPDEVVTAEQSSAAPNEVETGDASSEEHRPAGPRIAIDDS